MKERIKIMLLATIYVGMGCTVVGLEGCKPEPATVAGRSYNYQCLWTGGPNDFSPYGDFAEGGTMTHHDDTATISGTWSNVEETVIWQLDNPPRNTRFRGTFDKNGMAGNISDDLGATGIFQGDRR